MTYLREQKKCKNKHTMIPTTFCYIFAVPGYGRETKTIKPSIKKCNRLKIREKNFKITPRLYAFRPRPILDTLARATA